MYMYMYVQLTSESIAREETITNFSKVTWFLIYMYIMHVQNVCVGLMICGFVFLSP